MTGQVTDKVYYRENVYDLIGVEGGPLFEPQDYGIEPLSPHTGCYRGFVAKYSLEDSGRFYLEELAVWTKLCFTRGESGEEAERIPPINKVVPRLRGDYFGLHLPIRFTGTLRLASGFIEDFYIHQGFQKASAYQTVLDVKLKKGRLVEVMDRSEEAAQRRGEFKKRYMKDGDVVGAVQEAFDLDLDLW